MTLRPGHLGLDVRMSLGKATLPVRPRLGQHLSGQPAVGMRKMIGDIGIESMAIRQFRHQPVMETLGANQSQTARATCISW